MIVHAKQQHVWPGLKLHIYMIRVRTRASIDVFSDHFFAIEPNLDSIITAGRQYAGSGADYVIRCGEIDDTILRHVQMLYAVRIGHGDWLPVIGFSVNNERPERTGGILLRR